MWCFLRENWEILSGLATAIGAVIAYVLNRRHELSWKRTEFLFGISERLNTDATLSEATAILEDRHPSVTLDALFPAAGAADPSLSAYRQKFDNLLNVFHALAYSVFTVKTLSPHEVAVFGWYLRRLCFHNGLRRYCDDNGFHNVIELCKETKLWREGATEADLKSSEVK
jgi:hypothetical protein